jgi:hypothetical protein
VKKHQNWGKMVKIGKQLPTFRILKNPWRGLAELDSFWMSLRNGQSNPLFSGGPLFNGHYDKAILSSATKGLQERQHMANRFIFGGRLSPTNCIAD